MKIAHQSVALRLAYRGVAMVAASLFVSGCAHVYDVRVESIRHSAEMPPTTYVLSCPAPAGTSADPVREDALDTVQTALRSRGLVPASPGSTAGLVIDVAYGVGPRRLKAISDSSPEDLWGARTYIVNPDGDSLQECTVTLVNTGALKRVVSVFEKRLILVARESTRGAGGPSGRELWRVDVSIEDRGHALEDALPVLGAVLAEYIGTDSGKIRIRRISEKAVEELAVSTNS